MPRAVLDMADRRPIWAMPDWVPQRLRAAFPTGWELVVMEEETDGSGDGAGRVSDVVLDAVSTAEVYFGYGIGAQLLSGGNLEWVHSGAAGVGSSLTPEMLASPVLFTNSAGVHAPPMAETVLAMILFFGRGLDLAVRSQRLGRWDKDAFYRAGAPVGELAEATVGIVGFGGVGQEVARRVAALGARVIAAVRGPPRPGLADLEPLVGEAGLGERIDVLHGEDGLDTVLRGSEILVLAAPETVETRGMIDATALERLKEGALLINVARGKLVDEAALVRSLESGRLRGAGLDVFAQEPLPADHPLWSLPNVIITPHVSAVTRGFWDRETDLMTENVRRYLRGETLLNLVDKQAGY